MPNLIIITPANHAGIISTEMHTVWRRKWFKEACHRVLLGSQSSCWESVIPDGFWFMNCLAYKHEEAWAVSDIEGRPVKVQDLPNTPVELWGYCRWIITADELMPLSANLAQAVTCKTFGKLTFQSTVPRAESDDVITNHALGWSAFERPAVLDMQHRFHAFSEVCIQAGAWLVP